MLDLLFPKKCVNCRKAGSYLCSACFSFLSYDPERICLHCNLSSWNGLTHPKCVKKQGIDGCFSALSYNGVMKRLLFTFKYQPYVSDLHHVLSDLFYEGIIQNEFFMSVYTKEAMFMPIPLHNSKLRKRGYNHAALLAKDLGIKLENEMVEGLIRTQKTESQFLLTREEREENVKNVFQVKDKIKEKLVEKTVFVVDDVVTTGSTLKEAAKVLKKAGVTEVYGLTLAHGH